MTQVSVAIVQQAPVFLNLPASVDLAARLTETAAADGAAIVVFPETWLPGYPVWLDEAPGAAQWKHPGATALFRHLFENAVTLGDAHHRRLADVAMRVGVELVIGCHERIGASLFNSVLRLGPDGAFDIRRKITPTYNERLIWASADGSSLRGWDSPHGRLGALICWEHWMPLARAAIHATGEDIHFALWPAVNELHLLASRHYAFEGQCFVIAAGAMLTRQQVIDGIGTLPNLLPEARAMLDSIPEERAILKAGGSAVVAPDTSLLAGPERGEAAIVSATLDLELLASGRLYLDVNGHYSRPDILRLTVDRTARSTVGFDDSEAG